MTETKRILGPLTVKWGESVKIVDTNGGTVATMGWLTKPHQGPRRPVDKVRAAANRFAASELMEEALEATEALDFIKCDEHGDEYRPETCARCSPIADDARLKRRAALAAARGETP